MCKVKQYIRFLFVQFLVFLPNFVAEQRKSFTNSKMLPKGAVHAQYNSPAPFVKKNVPWHILAPRRGCFGNHLPLRRVRILAERFYRIETKFPIRQKIRLLHVESTRKRRIFLIHRIKYPQSAYSIIHSQLKIS